MPDEQPNADQPKEDFEGAFHRSRRSLKHLFHMHHQKTKPYNPNSCDGCKEIHRFLIDPNYRGDEGYPVYDRIDPDVMLGPDDFEAPTVPNS